ncbi:hypothetical protein SR80_20330 [Enterobacter hormaechei subsp. xiangfangensis]|uniref:Nickel resistance protein NreB n=4 Tax=Enterobacteriaceae TaxID=543 RepID=A0A220QIF1_KLEPN|nr:hypothetical protein ECL_A118 [Enterobacter cloacae subsp. cloacae ATCC 13047]AHM87978.1 Nickel resistance protein NreB [Klebsiella pneumoniae 30660/NJST258_1]AJB46352.1 hypothetical protein LI63_00325 [Enterobacter hormaechei subsp. xiangfangensis]AKZ86889.1 hypothetical protein LI65_025385 [Enterobacter hormaechei subsp. steigerwaltii]APR45092.1 hypothetical protein AM329_23895 [Enterobacter cloacae complex sp. AR_0002]ARA29553.1 hypothetical protein AM444_24280 [Enterobacter cloacae comp
MLHIFSLSNRTYRYLFMVLIIALIGTGLATVALGLLAGDRAGGVGNGAGNEDACLYSGRPGR